MNSPVCRTRQDQDEVLPNTTRAIKTRRVVWESSRRLYN